MRSRLRALNDAKRAKGYSIDLGESNCSITSWDQRQNGLSLGESVVLPLREHAFNSFSWITMAETAALG